MRRTLLPLSLLAAALAAQDPPAPPVLPGDVQIPDLLFEQATPEALAKAQWLVPGPVAEPKWTLYVCTTTDELREQRGCLEDLQRRFGERGVRIAAVLAPDEAKALAAQKPPLAVASLAEVVALHRTCWLAAGAEAPVPAAVDGAADLLAAAAGGKELVPLIGALQQLEALVSRVGDGGPFAQPVAQIAALLPHSGRARSLAVLVEWWCTGDLAAARKQFDAGLQALANEPWALAMFADLVLRGDRNDPGIAKELAMALTPVAAAAPDNPFVQLVQLRALLRAGQDKLAGRMLSAVGKLCDGDARNQVLYAETLMEANEPAAYRPLAERALDAAAAAGFDPHWIAAARYKVLVRSGAPAEECDKFLADFRSSSHIDRSMLNNDAWYLMIKPETMGRFDTYALGQCEEMQRQEGEGMSFGYQDTFALALFLNGRLQNAIELEEKALAASGNRAHYAERLARYKNTLAAQKPKK